MRDGAFHLASVTHIDRTHLDAKRGRHRLDRTQTGRCRTVVAGSRRTATRFILGAICLSSSSHFPLRLYSNMSKAGGIATGPRQAINEAGTNWIDNRYEHNRHSAGCLQHRPAVECQRSGSRPARARPIRPRVGEFSRHRPRPSECRCAHCGQSVQPNCASACWNAAIRTCSVSFAVAAMITPMRLTRSSCCARAASGQAVATPPRMNSRRLIASPEAEDKASYRLRLASRKGADVRFGSKADICGAKSHVRFTPKSGHVRCTRRCLLCANSGHRHYSITSSACASSVGEMVKPSVFAVLRLMTSSNLTVCWTGNSPGTSPLRTRPA